MSQSKTSQGISVTNRWLAVTVTIGGRPRTFAPSSWLGGVLAIGLPALATWYLGATLYFVFHDPLLASLIARQTDAQYAYEDRIAGLSTQLDRETSRALVDRHMLETTVSALEDRSVRLAARTMVLDRLVARNVPAPIPGPTPSPAAAKIRAPLIASRNPLLGAAPTTALPADVSAYSAAESPSVTTPKLDQPTLGLRNDTSDGGSLLRQMPVPDKRAALNDPAPSIVTRAETVAATLSDIERDQSNAIAALREPTLKAIAKLRMALTELGLPAGIVRTAGRTSDLGGPFVPLPSGALTFEQDSALLQDALVEADRLAAITDTVPLHKPLAGPLEITSTFGPRIDPFLGRPAMHTGIDFREAYGESVHATAGGIVTIAASEGGYGTMVEIDHGNGLSSRYAHLSSTSVVPGQKIETGAVVGRVGSSGRATGPHLHYETRIKGEAVDPTRFLKAGAKIFADN